MRSGALSSPPTGRSGQTRGREAIRLRDPSAKPPPVGDTLTLKTFFAASPPRWLN